MSRGVVVYDGPSLIDGSPIVAVTTFRSAIMPSPPLC